MHSTVLLLALAPLLSLTLAQTSQSASDLGDPKCLANNILQACLSQANAQVSACIPSDYHCLCENYTFARGCWNNCPNSAGLSPAQQQVDGFCAADKATSSLFSPTSSASVEQESSTSLSALSAAASDSISPGVSKGTPTGAAASGGGRVGGGQAGTISNSASTSLKASGTATTATGNADVVISTGVRGKIVVLALFIIGLGVPTGIIGNMAV